MYQKTPQNYRKKLQRSKAISEVLKMMILIMLFCLMKRAAAAGLQREKGGKLIAKSRLLSSSTLSSSSSAQMKLGLIVDENDWLGQMGLSCIEMGLSDFYASHPHYHTRLVLHTANYRGLDVVSASAAAVQLMKDVQAKAIIGPLTSTETNFVISLGTKVQVPIISYTATSPILSSLGSPYFIRATQDDFIQVQTISALIQAFGWKEVVPIYGNNEFGEGIMPSLVDMLQSNNTRIPYHTAISSSATDDQILEELYKLRAMQTRVFIVHLWPTIGSRFFKKAKEAGMMSEDYVWILTNGIGNLLESFDNSVLESMQGVLALRTYVPKTSKLENFTIRWSQNFKHDHPKMADNKLNVYGLWAYDAATSLAMAAEKVGSSLNSGFLNKIMKNTSSNSTDLNNLGVSKVGPKLLKAISKTNFKGLAGEFSLSKGELQSSTFQIINVVGNGWREVGFWTPENGFSRDLNTGVYKGRYSASKDDLRGIVWPGDSFSVPRGWVIPSTGKKLRIGVPVRPGFQEFLKITKNNETGTTEFTGFCIDVFDSVMEKLPYYVPYEYVPYANPNGSAAGSYNDLVYQVFQGNYDAVVGDVTIIANRSQYIDYTLPYTESGVTMVVPIKQVKTSKAWVFLKPLTWDLWVTTVCFFAFIALVVWVLEHRVNEEFRGPPLHQAGTTLYYSFSSMVFAHNENVFSNHARFVMVVWTFVVLILSQSYTASLTSMLTVQQLQPQVQDVNEMIRKGEYVGYQQGSFVFGLLKELGFKESRLKSYKNCDELDDLLSKGSGNGGIAAVFDEVPYMMLFTAKYCNKFTMTKPNYKTGGFGFVFPKGSPMVSDVSRAVLNVTEGEKMVKLEKEWINQQDACPNASNNPDVSHDSLGLTSFWGLFLIAGLTATFAVISFMIDFLRKHWHIVNQPDNSFRAKLRLLLDVYDKKDLSSHTFKKKQEQLEMSAHYCQRDEVDNGAESMANTHCPPSPDENGRDSAFSSVQGSPSPGFYHSRK